MASKDNRDELYVYQLVEFVSRKKQKCIDVVPSEWVSFDRTKSTLVAKFMPPPYNEENNDLLYGLIKKRASAPEDWPTYSVKIRGQASK